MNTASRWLAVLFAVLLLGAAVTGRLDRWNDAAIPALSQDRAVTTLEGVQVRAAAAYAIARALGGVIAVAASTTAEGGVGVAGLSVDIGRVLQPAMQLVDAFSDVMMVSLVSLTAQIILIEIMNAYALSVVLPIALGLLAMSLVLRGPPSGAWRRLARLFLLVALAARFALPLSVSATASLSDRFLRQHEQSAEQSVEMARGELPQATGSVFHPSELVGKIDRAVQGILTWMTVFILETIVMPVGLALLVVVVGRAIMVRGLIATLWPRRRAESPVM
jgi:hypothetical protein